MRICDSSGMEDGRGEKSGFRGGVFGGGRVGVFGRGGAAGGFFGGGAAGDGVGLRVEAGDRKSGRGEGEDTGFAEDVFDLGFEFGDAGVGELAFLDELVDLHAGFVGLTDDLGVGAEDDVAEG